MFDKLIITSQFILILIIKLQLIQVFINSSIYRVILYDIGNSYSFIYLFIFEVHPVLVIHVSMVELVQMRSRHSLAHVHLAIAVTAVKSKVYIPYGILYLFILKLLTLDVTEIIFSINITI